MAAIRKEKPFTIETMKTISNVNDAIKYFQNEVKKPLRTQKIVNLFNEAHELNIGSVSLNMAVFKKDPKLIDEFVKRNKLFSSEKSAIVLKEKIGAWYGKPIEREVIDREIIESKSIDKKVIEGEI